MPHISSWNPRIGHDDTGYVPMGEPGFQQLRGNIYSNGRDQSNWLADALKWEIPGASSIPQISGRDIPGIGSYLDTASRWLVPGVETQRMAEQGAGPWSLAGSMALDTLPVGMVAGRVGKTVKGVLPSGVSNVIKYPFRQGANLMSNLRGDPSLIPLRLDMLPTKPGMEQTFNKYLNLKTGEISPKYLIDPITTNPFTEYVPSRNWFTGREEAGISRT